MIGKTISGVVENEALDRVTLVFTDGTKTAIEFWASYAEDQGMEIKQLDENMPIPDAYRLRYEGKGYFSGNERQFGWEIHRTRARVMPLSGAKWIIRQLTGPVFVDYKKENFHIEPVYQVLGGE